jgi:hypothetical protein
VEKLSLRDFVADTNRFVLYCVALILLPISGWLRLSSNLPHFDFIVFYTAGYFVNTPSLLSVTDITTYEKLHHWGSGLFPYLPAFAWFYAPFAHVPITIAYFLYVVVSVVVICGIAEMLMRMYQLSRPLSYLLCFAWSPISAALLLGQNSIVALLICLALLHQQSRQRPIVAGVLLGLLFYKPVYGIYIFLWMLLGGEWLTCAAAVAVGGVWYLACIVATGGDKHWLTAWLHVFQSYRLPDIVSNQFALIAVPGFLERVGVSFSIAGLVGLAILAVTERYAKPLTKPDAFIVLLALLPVVSLHALPYDATFTVPALIRIMVLQPQRRFQILAFSYLIAATWLLARPLHIDLLALVTLPCPFFLLYLLRQGDRAPAHATTPAQITNGDTGSSNALLDT